MAPACSTGRTDGGHVCKIWKYAPTKAEGVHHLMLVVVPPHTDQNDPLVPAGGNNPRSPEINLAFRRCSWRQVSQQQLRCRRFKALDNSSVARQLPWRGFDTLLQQYARRST